MESNATATMETPQESTTVRLSVQAEELRAALKHLLKLVKPHEVLKLYARRIHLDLEDAQLLLSATDGFSAVVLSCPTIYAYGLPATISTDTARLWVDEMPMKGNTLCMGEPVSDPFPDFAVIDPGAGDGPWINKKYLIAALQAMDYADFVQIDTNRYNPTRLTPCTIEGNRVLAGYALIMPIRRTDRSTTAEHDD